MQNNLKKIRKDRGLTQEQLAIKQGTTHATISRYEKDNRNMPLWQLEVFARTLDCSIVDLISDNDTTQQTVLQEDLLSRIITIVLEFALEDKKKPINISDLSAMIASIYVWAEKDGNATNDNIRFYIKGALDREERSRNQA